MQIKVELGKSYRRRDGVVVTITSVVRGSRFPFRSSEGHSYNADGAADVIWQPIDLLAEVGEFTDAQISATTRTFGAAPESCVYARVEGHGRASVIVAALLRESAWVECLPHANDQYEITVMADRRKALADLL